MSITTYAELQTAIGNWLDRTDLSSRITEFIALFEAQINRRLRVRKQQTTTTLTVTSGVATLPTDYLEWKRLTWTGSPNRQLEYVSPEFLANINQSSVTGPPSYFTIEGESIKVGPLDNTSLSMMYEQKLPALTDSATTNWMLTAHPDGYLFGSLTMSATFTEDAQAGQAWNALTQNILGEIWGLDFVTRGTMTQRPSGPAP